MPDELVTKEEVARYLRVTPRTVTNLMRRRSIPFLKVGKLTRFDLTEVRAALPCTHHLTSL